MEPRIARYGNLVALPFNAAATRQRQHRDCPTFGPDRTGLWQQVTSMMRRHYQVWGNNGDWNSSYYHFLRGRFILDDWPLEKMAANRNGFLAFETRHQINCTTGKRLNYGFLIVDARNGELLGERKTGHMQHTPQTASGMDIIHPDKRGQGLSYAFFELGCLLAKEMGYTAYEASIAKNNPQSYRRLEAMVTEGRAIRQPDDWLKYRSYRIDLNAFTPRAI